MSNRFLVTQSLLSSWLWLYKASDPKKAQMDFLRVLERRKERPTGPMLDGIQFENMVTACCTGSPPATEHKWAAGVEAVSGIVQGGQFQVAASVRRQIEDTDFVLYGRLDALKAGVIYDIKFSRSYEPGKFLDSPQHPMYFECCPEVQKFVYLVSNGTDLCREEYLREDTPSIELTIRQFIRYLKSTGLLATYYNNWRSKY